MLRKDHFTRDDWRRLEVLLHKSVHSIVILPVVIRVLAVLEQKHPVHVKPVILYCIFHVFMSGLIKLRAGIVARNAFSGQLLTPTLPKRETSRPRKSDSRGRPDARPPVTLTLGFTYVSYFLPKPTLAPSES